MKINKKKDVQKKGGMSTMRMGTAGAVIGGAIGAGTAIALSNADRRKAIGDKIGELRTYAANAFGEVTAPKKFNREKTRIRKYISKAKN